MTERELQSGVWQSFEIIAEWQHMAKCLECGYKAVPWGKADTPKKSMGLRGLCDHLKIYHKDKPKEAEKIKEEQARKNEKRMRKKYKEPLR